MRDPFPPEHERRVTFSLDGPGERLREPPSVYGSSPRRSHAPPAAVAAAPASERPRSRPSFAEIDVVEADLARDPRVERD
jgi:hypothetical protein